MPLFQSGLVFRSWSPTLVGWSGTPTTDARYAVSGNTCFIEIFVTGTSNSTSTTFTLPITATTINFPFIITPITNNGTGAAGRAYLSSTTVVTCGISATSDTWTNTGTKVITVSFWYAI